MRGDGVGVGDVGAVPDIFWVEGNAAGGDDGGRAVRERQRHVLGGCGRHERDRTIQQCRNRVSGSDGAWVRAGARVVSALGRMGATGCEGTEWESETSVRCLTSSGARGTLRVAMTAGERSGSGSAMHSVDVGGLSVTGRSNGAGTGSASLTVHGSGLGLVLYTAMGRMGETGCEGTEWESETSVRCLTSSGSRGSRRVVITAIVQGGSLTRVMSIEAIGLSASRRSNAAGTGSAFVTVHGAGLGHAALTGMMRAGQTGCEGTEWESETSMRCLVGHGSRGTRRVTLTAGELSGSMTEALSVDVTGMSAMGRGNAAGTGSAWVTVHGGGLGLQAHTGLVRIGETGCEGTEWESETSVRVLTSSGSRGTRRVVTTAGERSGSGSAMYSVDVGGMSVTGRQTVRGGAASVTVLGLGCVVQRWDGWGRRDARGRSGSRRRRCGA
jgi:hypothetical protein